MPTTKVLEDTQAVQIIQIPKGFQLNTKLVWINEVHNGLLIQAKPLSWDDFFLAAPSVTDDFNMSRG